MMDKGEQDVWIAAFGPQLDRIAVMEDDLIEIKGVVRRQGRQRNLGDAVCRASQELNEADDRFIGAATDHRASS